MLQTTAITLSLIFSSLSAIHIYWALGGKWALGLAVPEMEKGNKTFTPGVGATLVVAFGLFCFTLITFSNVFLSKETLGKYINYIISYGMWFIAVIFLLRAIGEFKYVGLFKKIKNTDFAKADTKIFTPLCLIISTLSFIIILSK